MNQPRRKRPAQRRTAHVKQNTPVDIWRIPGPLPDVEPISIPDDVGALLRSLGDPPLVGGVIASHYFTAVIERTADVAAALALSADLLTSSDDRENNSGQLTI